MGIPNDRKGSGVCFPNTILQSSVVYPVWALFFTKYRMNQWAFECLFGFFCYLFYHSRSSWSSENAADYKKNRQKKGTVSFRYIRHKHTERHFVNYCFYLICSDEIQLAHLPQNNLGLCNLTTCLVPLLLFHPLAKYFCCLNVSSNNFLCTESRNYGWQIRFWILGELVGHSLPCLRPTVADPHAVETVSFQDVTSYSTTTAACSEFIVTRSI